MTTHYLKISPEWYERVKSGQKRAEVRRHDRDYQVGDSLILVKSQPTSLLAEQLAQRSGAQILSANIKHVLTAVDGIDPGFAVLSIECVGHMTVKVDI
jgi:ASC-1-like (ASCH) protein